MLRTLLPTRISGQIALLIVAAIAAVHVILTATFMLRSHDHLPRRHPAEIEMAAGVLDATPPQDRDRVFAAITERYPDLALRLDRSKLREWPKPVGEQQEHGF